MTPEEKARASIDAKLMQSGWILQDDIIENLQSALESFQELKAQLK